MTKQTHFRTFQIKRNDNLSVPIGNLVWAQAFFERFDLDEVVRAFKTKGTDLAKLAERDRATVKICRFKKSQQRLLSKSSKNILHQEQLETE